MTGSSHFLAAAGLSFGDVLSLLLSWWVNWRVLPATNSHEGERKSYPCVQHGIAFLFRFVPGFSAFQRIVFLAQLFAQFFLRRQIQLILGCKNLSFIFRQRVLYDCVTL